jgi:hypothetical protein
MIFLLLIFPDGLVESIDASGVLILIDSIIELMETAIASDAPLLLGILGVGLGILPL